jgi:ppGpp synthetase/RelA/SpoT-type nucleotidyltranferase
LLLGYTTAFKTGWTGVSGGSGYDRNTQMAESPTKSSLNKLGERFRKGTASDDDVRALNQFRESFRPAYERVVATLESLGVEVGGRSGKTIGSIVAKLDREKTRLSTMQDIAGCRVEVADRIEQDGLVKEIAKRFPGAKIEDRRERPSHGYRAVHAIVQVEESWVEIQVRTTLQNAWAQATERLSDRMDRNIKYGGGPDVIRDLLQDISTLLDEFERTEAQALVGGIQTERLTEIKGKLHRLLENLILRLPNSSED